MNTKQLIISIERNIKGYSPQATVTEDKNNNRIEIVIQDGILPMTIIDIIRQYYYTEIIVTEIRAVGPCIKILCKWRITQ